MIELATAAANQKREFKAPLGAFLLAAARAHGVKHVFRINI